MPTQSHEHDGRTEREPMTHEIVKNVKTLCARLARHAAATEVAKDERLDNEADLLDAVREAIPLDLFDALGTGALRIVKREASTLYLTRAKTCVAWGMTSGTDDAVLTITLDAVLDGFTLEEVIGGIVSALAERIDHKHEFGKKLARVNRRLRGILSILDNS